MSAEQQFNPLTHREEYDKTERELEKVKGMSLGEKTPKEIGALLAERERLASELEALKGEAKDQADKENRVFNHAPERRQTLTTAIEGQKMSIEKHEDRIKVLKQGIEDLNKEIEEITGKPVSAETEAQAVPNIETLQKFNQQFLFDTFKGWYSERGAQKAKQSARLEKPDTLDCQNLSQDIDTNKFGEYTLNPDTQTIDFEKAKPIVIELPQFVGQPLWEAMKYIIDTYAGTHHIPGLEYWKWIIENPNKTPQSLKDGNWHFLPGSILRGEGGRWIVPRVVWNDSEFGRSAGWLGVAWYAFERVVLIEKEKKKGE
jgi:FtsZ-binding cell division protein ZapB